MTETYDIRQHTAVLTPSKGSKTKYHCPVCDGDDLDISKEGKYNCFSGGCETKDIRAAIDRLEGKPEWKPAQEWKKPNRPKSQKEYFYPNRDGNPLVKVLRIDHGDGSKKDFPQSHWDGGKWIKNNPDKVKKLIPIYRYAEVREAIERNELIFWVEGESIADILWGLGIAATTTIGGSGAYSSYGDYLEDLKGARLVLAPDKDKNGVKYISQVANDFPTHIEGYYLAGTFGLWDKPSGGMDIGDDIRDHQLTKEQILEKVISPGDYREAINPKETETNKSTHFTSSIDGGLVKVSVDGDKKVRESIGNHLAAIAYVNNPEQDGAALLLEFKTIRGSVRSWTMARADLAGDGAAIVAGLLSRDYTFKRKQKNLLLDYLHGLGSDVESTYTITDSSGWVGKSFVLPHKTHGDESLKFRDVEPSPDAMTEAKGSLAEWNQYIGFKCQSNSRMTFVVGMAFAAPLLPLVGMEPGGLHLVGNTSEGKSTLLKVANSVTGGKEVQSWRSTANGLEAIATAHNHILLPIDELGQAEKSVGEAIYMLGNGQGKTRMTKQLANRKPKTWQLLFLSSGEIGLGEYMAQAGITQKGGQEVRMPSIPAVPNGSPFGVFEAIHGCDDSKEFATNIEAACRRYHGSAMDAFLSRLVVDRADEKFIRTLRSRVSEVAKKLAEGTKDHAVSRVASRFALTQVALELAHSYGVLAFSVENIEWSVKKMFTDWLDDRGGDGSIEIKKALERIKHLLVTNEFSRRVFTLPNNDGLKADNLLAYRKLGLEGDTEEFWVPSSVFDIEFATGVNKAELVRELQRLGWLLPPRKDGKAIRLREVKGKAKYYYVFGKRENSDDGSDGSDGSTSKSISVKVSTPSGSHHIPEIGSDGSDGGDGIHGLAITPITQPLSASDGDITDINPLVEAVLALPSLPSPPSSPKTDLGSFIPEKVLKVGDRVTSERIGKVGTVKSTRIEKTPKGTEFTKYLVDFGFDEHWFEAVALTLDVAQ
jgi:putative DNA primase/helicase